MRITVSRVPEEGTTMEATYDPAALDMERDDTHLASPIHVNSFVWKQQDELFVRAVIDCELKMLCARCLMEFTTNVNKEALLTYHVAKLNWVDITDNVRQEVMLDYPMIPVCSAACKGLCPQCGQDLNQGACNCHGTTNE